MHGVSAASDLPHLKVCFHSISHIKVRRRLTVNTSEELAGRENSCAFSSLHLPVPSQGNENQGQTQETGILVHREKNSYPLGQSP